MNHALTTSFPDTFVASQSASAAPNSIELLRARLDAIYTPLESAIEELHNRRLRFAGRTPGCDWLPDDLPDHPRGCAFLHRGVATPNYETLHFLNIADSADLLPVLYGPTQDKFVTQNPLKLGLARMGFHSGFSRHGQALVEFVNVLDLNQQGHQFVDLHTYWRQSVITFHREMLAHMLNGGRHPVVLDSSLQYIRSGRSAAAYYRNCFLRIFVANGILFEDFLLDQMELPFTRDVVLPAFDTVTAEFGIPPLIVRLSSPNEETLPHWYWYPGELKEFVKSRLQGARA